MIMVKLKVAELRKIKGIGQQDLAKVLGVSFQSVSKWETGTTMPDITLLPSIAEFFNVSVDQLLGLKPLRDQEYMQETRIIVKLGMGKLKSYLKIENTFGTMII